MASCFSKTVQMLHVLVKVLRLSLIIHACSLSCLQMFTADPDARAAVMTVPDKLCQYQYSVHRAAMNSFLPACPSGWFPAGCEILF